jgi:aminoglycoside phosphotransferase (APT) family kinase protein
VTTTESLPGLDPEQAGRWLAEHVTGAEPPLTFRLIAGGHSNLTYAVTDAAGRRWALRRPPLGGVLATAHDMGREWQFLSALHPTPVPLPRPVARCEDTAVIGADFYVMDFVDGVVLGTPAAGAAVPAEVRPRVAESTVDTLAALHAQDVDAIGLGGLRRPGSFVERQLRRWHRQVHASAVADLSVVDAAHDALAAAVPPGRDGVVHGDFRPGNLLYGPDGQVRAVLDWELASIGDPLVDLGWLLATWAEDGDPAPAATDGPTSAGGFGSRAALLERYAAATGTDVADIGYYVAFARWRAACIAAGVHTRYAAGNMGDQEHDAEAALARVQGLAAAALAAL